MAGNPREVFEVHPLESVYHQEHPDDPLNFGRHKVQLRERGKVEATELSAELRFRPRARLQFEVSDQPTLVEALDRMFDNDDDDGPVQIEFSDLGTSVDTWETSSDGSTRIYTPTRDPVQIRPQSPEIKRAVCHLFNWPDFMGRDDFVVKTSESTHGFGRVKMQFGDWSVTIAALPETRERVKALKEAGGYVITHAGEIRRVDDSLFGTADLEKVLAFLQHLFAFVMGRWSGPDLVVAFNEDGGRVFEQWGVARHKRDAWSGSHSIFDSHHAHILTDLAPGFWSLWGKELWQRPLRHTLYWYLCANDLEGGTNVDSGLLLSQPALELLSWNYLNREKKILSPKSFNPGSDLNAGNRFRVLAATLGLPLEIPKSLSKLRSECEKPKDPDLDAMDNLTRLRNGLVHPTKDPEPMAGGVYYDAWRLSLWYVEMCILCLCGYSGDYSNRISKKRWRGTVEPVPWAPRTEK